jgi:hypothetical protein
MYSLFLYRFALQFQTNKNYSQLVYLFFQRFIFQTHEHVIMTMYSGFVRHVVCNRLNFRFRLTSLLPSRTTATCPKPLRATKGKAASVGSKHFVDFKEV